jgi:hypothetical protein
MSSAPITEQPVIFDERLVAKIARRRARGQSWESVAAEFHWDVDDLCYTCDREGAYAAALERAQKDVDDEADAEGMHKLRELLRHKRASVALDAATVLTKYLADTRRDATRLAVEKLRAETKIACANARRDAALGKHRPDDDPPLTDADKDQAVRAFWRGQDYSAEDASKPRAEVYLWGGDHKLGSTLPSEKDVRVIVMADDTNNGRKLYWVMTYPTPTDIQHGPFPATAPLPDLQPCPPEVAERLAAGAQAI